MEVYSIVGNGLLENAYQRCLCHELTKAGFSVVEQVGLPLVYGGVRIEVAYRPDIIVDQQVIIEIKTVAAFQPVHDAQLLTYMRLAKIERGLLLNFHAVPFKKGIRRLILSKTPDAQFQRCL